MKIFSDGSLGARSTAAARIALYENEPDNYGIAVSTAEHLRQVVEKAAHAGLAVHIHAIGDQANRNVLDAIAATRRATVSACTCATASSTPRCWTRATCPASPSCR